MGRSIIPRTCIEFIMGIKRGIKSSQFAKSKSIFARSGARSLEAKHLLVSHLKYHLPTGQEDGLFVQHVKLYLQDGYYGVADVL